MFTEDLSAFFNPAEFASPATLAGVSVSGIFDNGYDTSLGMSTSNPSVLLPDGSVPTPVVGLLYVRNGTTYAVVEPMPDGTGVTRLVLEVSA